MNPAPRGAGLFRRFARDGAGASIIEFGFVAPVLILLLMGIFDVGQRVLVTGTLQGAVNQAGRISGLENGPGAAEAVDSYVRNTVRRWAIGAEDDDFEIERRSYESFADVDIPELWIDANNNGTCDNSESYNDTNGNGSWDLRGGDEGQGGARDIVSYRVSVTYDRLFPVFLWRGQLENEADRRFSLGETVTVTAETVLVNQPFGEQTAREDAPDTGTCEDEA